MSMEKLRVGVIYGGRSGEHEVSVASAASVMQALDPQKYEVVPIGITHEGQWLAGADPRLLTSGSVSPQSADQQRDITRVTLTGDPTQHGLVAVGQGSQPAMGRLDVILPVLHGTYGEDGKLQGLLEMANLPYVGCGVLGSALGMDKEKAKLVLMASSLPVVEWETVMRRDVERDVESVCARIESSFGYPVFVKPANLGSSVGIGKAHNREELRESLQEAITFDRKLVVEPGVNCRELECGVLGNDDPIASIVGEVVPSNEFYDYHAKYIDNASRLHIPAPIPEETMSEVQQLAVRAFRALDLNGLARVDFFLDRDTGRLYINEVNTMPGFTQISMYPKLWEASGIPYSQLLDRLIELAIERFRDAQRNRTSFEPGA